MPARGGAGPLTQTIAVPSWLASMWLRMRAEALHGSIQINFTHGREATANVSWTIRPTEPS